MNIWLEFYTFRTDLIKLLMHLDSFVKIKFCFSDIKHARLVIMVKTVLRFVPHRILVLVVTKNVSATHVTIFMAAECIIMQQVRIHSKTLHFLKESFCYGGGVASMLVKIYTKDEMFHIVVNKYSMNLGYIQFLHLNVCV